jgi:hypothetical protein
MNQRWRAGNRLGAVVVRAVILDGDPCGHPGCLSHTTHPCEGCGRIAGRGEVSKTVEGMVEHIAAIREHNKEVTGDSPVN